MRRFDRNVRNADSRAAARDKVPFGTLTKRGHYDL
jgi:hypothetical protein